MNNLVGSYFLPLQFHGNIRSAVRLGKIDGTSKIFAVSHKRKVYLIEYELVRNYIEPITKEIHFTSISAGSEICFIDVFNRCDQSDDNLIVAIIISKSAECTDNFHLNLYSTGLNNENFNLETIGQNCENFALDYIPYGLNHALIVRHRTDGSHENILLVSGHDKAIRAYRVFHADSSHREIAIGEIFPELDRTSGVVLTMHVVYYDDYKNRITCAGCENGFLRFSVVDCSTDTVLKQLQIEYENPISNAEFFTLSEADLLDFRSDMKINLLVTNSIYQSEVFMDVLNQGLDQKRILQESASYDVCLCSLPVDINLDGTKQILIGTYGEELLLFKYDKESKNFTLMDQKAVQNPVHKMYSIDITGDGLSELLVVTTKGIQVYQHKLKPDIIKMLTDRLKKLSGEERVSS